MNPKEIFKECQFKIAGMDCAACALRLEKSLKKVAGVAEVKIMVTEEKAAISYTPEKVSPPKIKETIEKAGYEVSALDGPEKAAPRSREILRLSLVAAAILLSWSGIWKTFLSLDFFSLAAALLGGIPVFEKAYISLRARSVTMEVAMTLGILASLLAGESLAAAVIVFFTLVAEFLDELTTERSRRAIEELLKIFPQTSLVKRGEKELKLEPSQIHHDDIVVVKPGGRIPVDGEVIKGEASVNQAPLTGEPMPILKKEGDQVLAGSISEGMLQVKAVKVGKETTLGKIIKLVEEAESNKSPVQKFADRFSTRFVPAVLLFSLLVFLFTRNITSAIAVIVVACPCAIALATPLAVVASAGKAAKKGIIIKGGIFLEELSKIDTIVLDKTGTLTLGEPAVTEATELKVKNEKLKITKDEVLRLAAIAEKHSEHPLAKAVLEKAREAKIEVPEPEEFRAIRGQGVVADYQEQVILLGNRNLFRRREIPIPRDLEEYFGAQEKEGKTVVFVARNREVVGVLTVEDIVREETHLALKELKSEGFRRLVLLTGDSFRPAENVAHQVGIGEFFSEMLPQDKVKKVKELAKESKVLMVGDGINDAPALAQADVGMAMGAVGSDAAIEAADIALMTDDLRGVPEAIKIGKKTFGVIRQNIYGSIIFNIIGITLASVGILTPLLAAVFHAFPDFLLFLNSSRLLRR